MKFKIPMTFAAAVFTGLCWSNNLLASDSECYAEKVFLTINQPADYSVVIQFLDRDHDVFYKRTVKKEWQSNAAVKQAVFDFSGQKPTLKEVVMDESGEVISVGYGSTSESVLYSNTQPLNYVVVYQDSNGVELSRSAIKQCEESPSKEQLAQLRKFTQYFTAESGSKSGKLIGELQIMERVVRERAVQDIHSLGYRETLLDSLRHVNDTDTDLGTVTVPGVNLK